VTEGPAATPQQAAAPLRNATAWAGRRPGVAVPAAAAAGAALLDALAAGGPLGVLLAAAGAALAAAIMMRHLGRVSGPRLAGDAAGAVAAVTAILGDLRPGPEPVTAADPDTTPVDWDPPCPEDEDDALPGHRADKMLITAAAVRRRAAEDGILHQLPQLLLVADDGAVAELLGRHGIGRTGRLAADSR
jgi:hypothetical protein